MSPFKTLNQPSNQSSTNPNSSSNLPTPPRLINVTTPKSPHDPVEMVFEVVDAEGTNRHIIAKAYAYEIFDQLTEGEEWTSQQLQRQQSNVQRMRRSA